MGVIESGTAVAGVHRTRDRARVSTPLCPRQAGVAAQAATLGETHLPGS